MKTLRLINNSKILKTALTLILVLLIAAFAITWLLYGNHPVNKKAIGQFAEIIVPFGQYDEIHVIDGDKGVFLVREEMGDTLKLVSSDGSQLADLAPATDFVQKRGDLLMLQYEYINPEESFWTQRHIYYPIVNYKQLVTGMPMAETKITSAEISANGEYYYWKEEGSNRKGICAAEGEVISECGADESVKLMTAEGTVLLRNYGDERNQTREILDLHTGKTLDTKGHKVIDGNGHLWICQGNNPLRQDERYVVGSDFEELEEDFTGEDLQFSDDGKYLFGQKCVPSQDGKRVESKSFVADAYGNIIYEEAPRLYFDYGAEGDIEFVDIEGDKLLRRHYLADDKLLCDYIDLTTMERKDLGGEPVYSKMDFDDGIALCAIARERKYEDEDERYKGKQLSNYAFDYIYNISESSYFLEFDWYYVNGDGQVYDFAFEGAFPSQDGYAAVRSEKKWGVIKFKDVS
ncbi:MAG: WG repeat-containing protein [Firmicutes bacterium]|nr:WG repeat-containing protein [Bacillota bacterium]